MINKDNMKVYSHEEMLDKVLGVKGTAPRNKYEADMKKASEEATAEVAC